MDKIQKMLLKCLIDEEWWISYAERALELLNHDVMWRGIVEACKILKYPEPSAIHAQRLLGSTV